LSRKAWWPIFLVLLLVFTPWSAPAETPASDVERALNSIQGCDAYNITRTLASQEFAGRLTGDAGYTAAAKWAAARFKEWGLAPLSREQGYLQAFPSPYVIVEKAAMSLFLLEQGSQAGEPGFKEMKLEPEKDFLPLFFSASGDHTAEAVFAGWAISAPDLGYDDYAGLEVNGKFVFCFRGTPDPSDKRYEPYDQHRFRMKTAKEKGALGVIYIYEQPLSNPNGDWIEGFTPAMVSEKIADIIFKEKGVTSEEVKKDLLTFKRPLSFPLQTRVGLSVEAKHFPDGVGYNVVGCVKGSDPALSRECLVIGGHLDHNGRQMGLLFPGADDNASGSAAVMEIAEAFSKLSRKPRRAVVFVLFGGEEEGLKGSEYFAGHLPPGFETATTMFNFDMVGEGDAVGVGYSADDPELKAALEEADQHLKSLRAAHPIRGVGVRSSDFAPFYQKGIPCVSFHSNGPHLYYHQTGDTIYRINPDMLAAVSRLAFLAALARADK
jgi:hypothetical protein